ncbi:MAG TPA: hypothetical protein VKU00_15155 [Chthonomonadaceae bacterium]|nr:hypothetical protein [Chthonomonadaceae bacterium]
MIRLLLKLIGHGGAGIAKSRDGSSTGTVAGTRAKTVRCEKCQFDYVYEVTCKATGPLSSATGMEHHTANHALDVMLDNTIEPVPCPSCGWLQPDMVPVAKARYKRWMITVGSIALLTALLVMLLGLVALTDQNSPVGKWELIWSALILMVSIGFYVGRAYQVSKFDPNRIAPEVQKAIGQKVAITREDHEKQLQEAQAQKRDRREQAKRNMASGYGLPQATDELVRCPFCGYHQEVKNKRCVSCDKVLKGSK